MRDRLAEENSYRFYLLRLWSERHDGRAVWRCSLEEPATAARRGFDGLESLGSHLAAVCGGEGAEKATAEREGGERGAD